MVANKQILNLVRLWKESQYHRKSENLWRVLRVDVKHKKQDNLPNTMSHYKRFRGHILDAYTTQERPNISSKTEWEGRKLEREI